MFISDRAVWPRVSPLHVLALICLSAVPSSAHDAPEIFFSGRLMPAERVPVDVSSETLDVRLTPIDPDHFDVRSLSIAEVSLRYRLLADEDITIPVMLPVYGGAAEVAFRLNGREISPRIVREADLYARYSPIWRARIDAFIENDERLREIVADAQPAIEEERARRAEDARHSEVGLSRLLWGQFERRLRQLGLDEGLSWQLAHYVRESWDGFFGGPERGWTAYAGARMRMTAERHLSLALDQNAPDPLALWGIRTRPSGHGVMFFCVAELPLHAGENEVQVAYRQPTGFVNRDPVGEPVRLGCGNLVVGQFDFVLRTAEHWRRVGEIEAVVTLPESMEYVECGLPGAEIDLDGPPRVRLSMAGMPSANLRVRFSGREWIEEQPREPGHSDVRRVGLEPVWEAVGAQGPPVIDEGRVIPAGGEVMPVFDLESGRRLAEFSPGGRITDVAVEGDLVLMGTGGHRWAEGAGLALGEFSSRSIRWAVRPDDRQWGEMTVLLQGETAVAAGSAMVMAVDVGSGEKLWEVEFRTHAMAADDNRVYLCGTAERGSGDFKDAERTRARALDIRGGDQLWETAVGYLVDTVALDGPRLLAMARPERLAAPQLIELRPDDGAIRSRRQFPPLSVGMIIPQGDTLTVIGDRGVSNYTVGATPRENWTVRSKYQMLRWVEPRDGIMYMLIEDGLGRVDVRTGEVEWIAPQVERRGDYFAAAGDVFVKVEGLGGGIACLTTSELSEPGTVPLTGRVPADLGETATSVPAAGWARPSYTVYGEEAFTPSGGVAPDEPEYIVFGRDVPKHEGHPGEDEVGPPREIEAEAIDEAAAPTGRIVAAGAVAALLTLTLLLGLVMRRHAEAR
ncbi:MAG: PQQ-binding-like beta-propeller repeat protein [Armatimonadota bacterium]|jgi:hypothetical protein